MANNEIIDGFSGTGSKLKVNIDGSIDNTNKNDFYLDIPLGRIDGMKYFLLSGKNPNIDSGQSVDIWSLADEVPEVNYPVDDIAVTMYMSSTSASDVGNSIYCEGLDADYNEQTGVAVLNGQNQVEIKDTLGNSITFLRFFLAQNLGDTALLGNVYVAESDTLTAGIPDTDSKKYSKILLGDERTFDAVYTVPLGKITNANLINFAVNRGKDALLVTKIRFDGGIWITTNSFPIFQSFVAPPLFYVPGFIPEKVDIKFSTTVSNDDTSVTARADLLLIDEDIV